MVRLGTPKPQARESDSGENASKRVHEIGSRILVVPPDKANSDEEREGNTKRPYRPSLLHGHFDQASQFLL